ASAELLAREARDRVARLAVVTELDESETLGASSLPIGDDGHGLDIAVLGEEIAKILFAGGVGKVTNVQLHRNEILFRRPNYRPRRAARRNRLPVGTSDFGAKLRSKGERYEKAVKCTRAAPLSQVEPFRE